MMKIIAVFLAVVACTNAKVCFFWINLLLSLVLVLYHRRYSLSSAMSQELWEFDEQFDESAAKVKVETTKSGVFLLDQHNLEVGIAENPFLMTAMVAGDDASKKNALNVLEDVAAILAKKGISKPTLAMVCVAGSLSAAFH
jgi:hypothetical protein